MAIETQTQIKIKIEIGSKVEITVEIDSRIERKIESSGAFGDRLRVSISLDGMERKEPRQGMRVSTN